MTHRKAFVEDTDRPALMPSEDVMSLHHLHERFESLSEFQALLTDKLQQARLLGDCADLTRNLGMIEPLSGEHIPPDQILINTQNLRESIIAKGILSRNRALLMVLEHTYGSLTRLANQDVYLVEALSGLAHWMRRHLGEKRLHLSEFLENAEYEMHKIPHQDLCALTYANQSFDLVLCNELFEHIRDLDLAFREIARVLRPGGRLVATCPLAFGQQESIVKAIHNWETGLPSLQTEPEFHGDPVRPNRGSLVYRIPGWEILDQLRAAGFTQAYIHHIASWKHGVLGIDIPGVLVVEAQH